MNRLRLGFMAIFFVSSLAVADAGLVSVKSAHDVHVTADRFEKSLIAKGMTVFKRIDHADAARKIETKLRPTELIIFGNPKVGTPLMLCSQTIAIDLPQKALVWEDEAGQVWLSYNNPKVLAERHGIKDCDEVINKVRKALGAFAKTATMP